VHMIVHEAIEIKEFREESMKELMDKARMVISGPLVPEVS
jgi:hypothetical protein